VVDTCIYLNIRKREKMKSEIKCILVTNMYSYSDYSRPILTIIKTERSQIASDKLHEA